MLSQYPKFKRNDIENHYKKLPKAEQTIIKEYLDYRRARGVTTEQKIEDIRRYITQIRVILDKNFNKIDLKDLRILLAIINQSWLSDGTKNNLKIDVKNFMKYLFKDWSIRFNGLEDIKKNYTTNEKKINAKNMFSKKDIESCMKHETKMYWKAFLITQYEGALRTKEVRFLKWNDIKFNVDDDISEISIYATKTKKARTIFVKEATFYLQKLKEEQENIQNKSIYCFPSKKNINEPIDKWGVSMWFRNLTKKALGEMRWNYLLRHSRATELYRLAEQGKISKDTAIRFMGHSEDMTKTYTHLDSQEVKEMLKEQIYKLEDLPPEKKAELEKKIEEQQKTIDNISKRAGIQTKITQILLKLQLGQITKKELEQEKNNLKKLMTKWGLEYE